MTYQKLVTFGSSLQIDPVNLCIGTNMAQPFNHGSNSAIYGQNSPECQIYMAQRCAKKWDTLCEIASNPGTNPEYATRASTMGQGMRGVINLTPEDILIRNTAMEKYRISMHGGNCSLKTEQFNPINPSSPYMTYYVGECVPEFSVDPKIIDFDPVMDKILNKPNIASQLLVNIFNTMKRKGTLHDLKGTKLGKFFNIPDC